MPSTHPTAPVIQGFAVPTHERLPMLATDAMSAAQREAADALIAGPRKAVFGPFIPLLRSPELMSRVGKVGEYLRFDSVLEVRIRELVMCLVARHVSNQFEWLMHAPLALKAGVPQASLDAIAEGRYPHSTAPDEAAAVDLVTELLQHHGVSDSSYAAALGVFGEQGVVELSTLVGYFAMVCWVMNVARTPTDNKPGFAPLAAFPA
ncbi:carboxymuconolactone decarboxylase family protein [Polaromonas sp. A23]|uniref:carboxymuconolactone decarboxylase family protein n=1 Tax=Polaromonas sp. A23 TaxID=1944133 RepID=UPI0009869992|nr:carboxymuconolactone decarboxylase family protein [Polaromonas sp. A23]OOG46248.1 carboxymuconolactone decarboxylase [Polaromonas sp. A23]